MSIKTLAATAIVAALAGATGSALVAPRVGADPQQSEEEIVLPPVGAPGSAWVDPTRSYVRLYSEGKVVDSWDPAGAGRMDGNSFVFPVRRGDQLVDVRIFGTFTFEGVPIR